MKGEGGGDADAVQQPLTGLNLPADARIVLLRHGFATGQPLFAVLLSPDQARGKQGTSVNDADVDGEDEAIAGANTDWWADEVHVNYTIAPMSAAGQIILNMVQLRLGACTAQRRARCRLCGIE